MSMACGKARGDAVHSPGRAAATRRQLLPGTPPLAPGPAPVDAPPNMWAIHALPSMRLDVSVDICARVQSRARPRLEARRVRVQNVRTAVRMSRYRGIHSIQTHV